MVSTLEKMLKYLKDGRVLKMENHEIIIREAEERDAEALLAIYAPYVKTTAITFEPELFTDST